VQVALAQKALADTVIKAPISGYVSDRPVAVGEYVAPTSKIATILRTDPIKLRLRVPEAEVAFVRAGLAVSARVDAYPDRQFDGQVSAINPAIEPASRAVIVEVDIKNAGNLMRPGMFATARIMQQGSQQAVFVPRSAVLADPNTNSYSAFVVEGTTALLRIVQVGEERDGFVRILSGVSSGEVVATTNLEELYEGAEVMR
jgi:RND family efflux transporter MFP subunit